ncbi:hypothetical protein Acsp03_13080 [Actinomadura sp. NBRC 104412]|uniref:DUF6912 family protein n=1 Tax=Actinomadura sp. NBRC 104412 TaxID=3032203 RepID=UPI0024A4E2DC|nr:hypothetical protein [Actinomadura sp. NBRC 104412]GLZ03842.1 hypothetical protein Acsp03_13080 [Actinomadura sp. NBRC 104412]
MRVYVPSTLTGLARVLADKEVGPAPLAAYAVTPALREWYASGDLEELEYAAMTAAARASLRLLAAEPETPARRVVLAAEVPDELVRAGSGDRFDEQTRALVQVTEPIPWRAIASGHVDDESAVADVRAAVQAVPAADKGDEDARFTVDGAEGHELLWYATQELEHLVP